VQGTYDLFRDGSFLTTLRDADEEPEPTRTLVTFVFSWPAKPDRRVP
jgi:hypothetical protein